MQQKVNQNRTAVDGVNVDLTKLESQEAGKDPSGCRFHHYRYVVITSGALIGGSMYMTRLSITVAILSMVNHTALYLHENPDADLAEAFRPDYVEVGEFNWSNEIQQIIIAGYMFTYTIPQLFATRIIKNLGIRRSLPVSNLMCALSCLLVPLAAYWGWGWVVALRMLNGLGAAAISPTLIGAVEVWTPPSESATGLAYLQFIQVQFSLATPIVAGLLAAIHWQWSFYFSSLIATIASIGWWIFAEDRPSASKYVGQRELDYIDGPRTGPEDKNQKLGKVREQELPWYFMFKLGSFHNATICWTMFNINMNFICFLLPSYLNRVLKLSVADNGLYMFIMGIGTMFSMLWPNPMANALQRKFGFSLSSSRTSVVFLLQFMTASSLLYVGLYHDNQLLALTINRFFLQTFDTVHTATIMSKFGQEGLTSQVFSMMNTIANFLSMIICWAAGRLLDYTGESIECWTFLFVSIALCQASVFFMYFFVVNSEPVQVRKREQLEQSTP